MTTRAGLDAFTEYLFRVRAANAAGAGRWSELARIATAPAPPSPPLRIAAAGGITPMLCRACRGLRDGKLLHVAASCIGECLYLTQHDSSVS